MTTTTFKHIVAGNTVVMGGQTLIVLTDPVAVGSRVQFTARCNGRTETHQVRPDWEVEVQ